MKDIMRVIVTGAAGFLGYNLTKALSDRGDTVFALVRPGSMHNELLKGMPNVEMIEVDLMGDFLLPDKVKDADVAFHLAWAGERNDFESQKKNVDATITLIKELKRLNCKRIITTGSQAEYGATTEVIKEDRMPNPFCAYGAAKVATLYLSKKLAFDLDIDWIWARIFSLYGVQEPENRMFPALLKALKDGEEFALSSCNQNWDYLDARDAANALIALAERGKSGEIYNVAAGDYRPLKEYVKIMEDITGTHGKITYGDDPSPYVSLSPDISKLKADTGWKPCITFEQGVRDSLSNL